MRVWTISYAYTRIEQHSESLPARVSALRLQRYQFFNAWGERVTVGLVSLGFHRLTVKLAMQEEVRKALIEVNSRQGLSELPRGRWSRTFIH